MGVGLQPLEFSECLTDSPAFREKLLRHEKELERTSQHIKRLIKEVKDVVQAAERLGAAQLALANTMEQFEFACVGVSLTDDERVIGRSLTLLATTLRTVDEERKRMLGRAHEQIIEPLERFRKQHIGAVKEGKKKFEKKTAKFCASQERTLSLSTRKGEAAFQEADAALEMAERDLCRASADYVLQLQAVREREKFDLVEPLLGFAQGWATFHHAAYDAHGDAAPRLTDAQLRVQRARAAFRHTERRAEALMRRVTDSRADPPADGADLSGYLFLMEKKAFGTTWTKHYCTYVSEDRVLTLQPYNQINAKAWAGAAAERVVVAGARPADAERRHCWEALPAGNAPPLLLQALSAAARGRWLRALGGGVGGSPPPPPPPAAAVLDARGFAFVRALTAELEARGLGEQGLYRVAGVSSKAARLVAAGGAADLSDAARWETRTLTSALKGYLRALPEPLLTADLHPLFIEAAKCEAVSERVSRVRALVRLLPAAERRLLRWVTRHLRRVAARAPLNLMPAANLAVCFGPTLARPPVDSLAAVLDIKFYNVLVETLIVHVDDIFEDDDDDEPGSPRYPQSAQCALARLSAGSSESGSSGSPPPGRARTLYACLGEGDGELSFEPNQVLTAVAPSGEPGWLRATLDGRHGLVPENYVEPLP